MSPNGTEMDEDPRLDAWIRAARREDGESEVSPEIVHAYLTGTANAEQKTLMRIALARSAELRAHVLAMSRHLESLQTPEAARSYERTKAPAVRREPQRDRLGAVQRAMQAVADFFAELTAPRRLAFALPAAAAAVVLLIVVPRLGKLPVLEPSGVTVVDPQRFTGAVTRGVATSHRDAADIEFENSLGLRDGRLVFQRQAPPATVPTRVRIRLLAASGETLREIDVAAAAGDQDAFMHSGETGDAVAWLIALPDGVGRAELRRFAITKPAFALHWPEPARRGLLTVTYGKPDGYAATPSIQVDLDQPVP